MTTARKPGRDQVAALAGVAAPLALSAILIPFRASLPNTDAALALILAVVAVAAAGHRAAGSAGRGLRAAAWFDFLPDRAVRAVHHLRHTGHRDHGADPGRRHRGDRDRGPGTPAAHCGCPPGRLPGRDQRRRARGGHRHRAEAADRSGMRAADPAAGTGGVPGSRTAPPGSGTCPGCCATAASSPPPGRHGTPSWQGCRPAGTPSCWPRPHGPGLQGPVPAHPRRGNPPEPGAAAGRRRPGRPGSRRTGRRPAGRPPLSRRDSPDRPRPACAGTGRCARAAPRDIPRPGGAVSMAFPETGQLAARPAVAAGRRCAGCCDGEEDAVPEEGPPAAVRPFSGRTAWARSLQTPLRVFLRTEATAARRPC